MSKNYLIDNISPVVTIQQPLSIWPFFQIPAKKQVSNILDELPVWKEWVTNIIMYIGFSDCNWTRTQNHLVRKRTLNHLPKLAK